MIAPDEKEKVQAERVTRFDMAGLHFELNTPLDVKTHDVLRELAKRCRHETLRNTPMWEVMGEIVSRPLRILGLTGKCKPLGTFRWKKDEVPCVVYQP